MESWRRFQPRPCFVEPAGDRGTKGRRSCGRPSKMVGRENFRESRARGWGNPKPSGLESTREKSLQRRDVDVRTGNRHRGAGRLARVEGLNAGEGDRKPGAPLSCA